MTARFGKDTNGANNTLHNANRLTLSQAILTEDAILSTISIRSAGNNTTQSRLWKGVIYSDNSGSPDALLFTSDEQTYASTTAQFRAANFSGQSLAAGTYWIGAIYDSNATTSLNIYRDNVASQALSRTITYSSGAPNPAGSMAALNGKIDCYVTYLSNNATTNINTATTSMSVNNPDFRSIGDKLVAIAQTRNIGAWTTPSGWFEVGSGNAASTGELTVFERTVDGTEPDTQTWTASVSTTAAFNIRRIPAAQWDGVTPIEVAFANSGGTVSVNNPPLLTPTWGLANTTWIAALGNTAQLTTLTAPPSGYGSFVSAIASSGGSLASTASASRQNNASSEDPGSFAATGERWWVAATIAVRPPGGAPVANSNFFIMM